MISVGSACRLWCLLLVFASLLAYAPRAESATLRGRVVNGATPLPGYSILLYATDPAQPLACANIVATGPRGLAPPIAAPLIGPPRKP